jgi:Zn-dependent peptidase ImmA (M78 family)
MDIAKARVIKDFVDFCKDALQISELPQIYFTQNRNWVLQKRSFGEYNTAIPSITVYTNNRNTADVIRTLAHEMVHHRQNELGKISLGSGQTGTKIEDQANAMAGVLLREYGLMNDLIYESISVKLYPDKMGVDIDYEEKQKQSEKQIKIPLSKLYRNEPADKMKSEKSKKNIETLSNLYKKGKKVDPILVRKTGERYQILDGHHRYTAAKLAKLDNINAIVIPEENITKVDTKGNPIKENINNEIFSAYRGRYIFDVTKAYDYIRTGKVKSEIKTFGPIYLDSFAHPDFSFTDPKKVASMKLDYEKPLGILVKFENPETKKTEFILIDGNHRVRKAADENKSAKVYVISDPKDTKKFMRVDPSKPHKLFPDEED